MENERTVNWEKIGAYVFIAVSLSSLFFYIADMKERTTKLESDYGHDERLKSVEEKIKKLEKK